MSASASANRGLRFMTIAALVMMARYAGEVLLALWALFGGGSVESFLRWLARLQFGSGVACLLLILGAALQLGELRRRRLSVTAAVVAIATLTGALAFHLWLYDLLSALPTSLVRVGELERLPARSLLAGLGYVVGLVAVVLTIRAYALTDDNLPLRELARATGGWLIALFVADTFYDYTYGLGSGGGFLGIWGALWAFGLLAAWIWVHRLFGRLVDTARYYLRETEFAMPRAEVVRGAPATAAIAPPAPAPAPPPPSVPVIAPIAAAAPTRADEVATPTGDGPRFLR